MKKVLIIGASGFIGSYSFKEFNKLSIYLVEGTFLSNEKENLIYLDYTKSETFIKKLIKINPDIIIWSAGVKNISKLEQDSFFSEEHNFLPIKSLVNYQNQTKKNIHFIFISSDYVFDGKDGDYSVYDNPNPNTSYGRSKLASEDYIKKSSPLYTILRVGAVVGSGSVFWDWLINELGSKKKVDLFDDIFSPTPLNTLFQALHTCINSKLKGVFHVSGGKSISRYEFGCLINRKLLKTDVSIVKIKRNTDYLINRALTCSKEFSELYTLDDFINESLV